MIFISYSWGDSPAVRAFNKRLVDEGYSTWIEFENLDLGESLEPQIQGALRLASLFLCVDSPHSRSSSWLQREIAWAMHAGIFVVNQPISRLAERWKLVQSNTGMHLAGFARR